MISKFITVFTLMLTVIMFNACSKKVITNNKPDDKDTTIPKETLEEVYLKEGFISENIFRVVIVDCIDKSNETLESLKEKALKRSLASLQKYIIENNMIYTNNTRAKLINLIEKNSSFSKQNISSRNNNVYYLDINKRNIQAYVDSLSRKR